VKEKKRKEKRTLVAVQRDKVMLPPPHFCVDFVKKTNNLINHHNND
jgi:hypothetical protein